MNALGRLAGRTWPRSARPAQVSLRGWARARSTLQVSETDATSLRLRWDDPAAGAAASGESRFHFTWLRDNCQCPACVHPSNRQKLHSSADVAQGVRPAKVTVLDGGQAGAGAAGAAGAVSAEKPRLEIVWESGSLRGQPGAAHTSVFGLDWLRRYNYAAPPVPAVRPLLWDAETYAASRREHSYDAFISTREGLEGVLAELRDFGLCFLRGVPTNDRQVETVARRIGCIRETFYGTSWDVRSVPDAKNIAYTSLYLGLHMDLMYFEAPPGLQFLHSLQNTVTGGHSIFTDTHRAVEILKTEHPEHYKTLAKVPVTFHYINDGHHMHFSRPTITPGDVNDGLKVFYAPPFQGPLEAPPDVVDAFYAAFRVFEDILNRPELVYRTLLQPGDCVIFANRRVLHGRESFDAASGARHLKGTYVDWDDFKDKLRVHGLHQRR